MRRLKLGMGFAFVGNKLYIYYREMGKTESFDTYSKELVMNWNNEETAEMCYTGVDLKC